VTHVLVRSPLMMLDDALLYTIMAYAFAVPKAVVATVVEVDHANDHMG
jgi:hypothetical protein